MRIAAIIYIILSVAANFIFDSLIFFVLAAFSFPILLFVLLRKKRQPLKKTATHTNPEVHIADKQEETQT